MGTPFVRGGTYFKSPPLNKQINVKAIIIQLKEIYVIL